MQNQGTGALRSQLSAAGYFPEFIADTVELSLADETVVAFFVHPETTLDNERFIRHQTVLVLTPTRLLINHTDESETRRSEFSFSRGAASTTESIPLERISAVALTRVCAHPERYRSGQSSVETWLQMSWGVVERLDLVPAACDDPTCEADHGYSGELTGDDLVVRISATADGPDKVAELERFAVAMQLATRASR